MEEVSQKRYDFAIATISQFLSNNVEDDLKQAVLSDGSSEDKTLLQQLVKNGIKSSRVIRAAWDDPNFDWSQCRVIVVRSVWNYHGKPQQFASWLRLISTTSQVVNNVDLMLWNMDKIYLKELSEQHNILIAPTEFVAQNDTQNTLQQILEKRGWNNNTIVVKAAISANADNCFLVLPQQAENYEQKFQALVENGGVLVQEFMQNIKTQGEISSVYFSGQFSHAVLKSPQNGDFRVQREFGGIHQPIELKDEKLMDFCQKAIAALPSQPLIARVDTVIDNQGNICLQEMEVIDCFLFLHCHIEGYQVLAQQLLELLK